MRLIKELSIRNFTVFSRADICLSPALNVFIGENGAGKTHLLKLLYAPVAACAGAARGKGIPPTKALLQREVADKLVGVFRPEALGRLTRRKPGRERCDVGLVFQQEEQNLAFSFSSNSKSEVVIETLPGIWESSMPVFLPTRELMSLYPNFVAVYEHHYLEFEETWRDTCIHLGAAVRRGPKDKKTARLLKGLSDAMEGSIELNKNGRFYLRTSTGRMEMPLVAEGLRKVACLAHLAGTGVFLDRGCLFWDEPEANLNPALLKQIAETLLLLCEDGIQVFLATHSLFLLRELEIRLADREFASLECAFFGLHKNQGGVEVLQSDSIDGVGDITALDEELMQSERYMDMLDDESVTKGRTPDVKCTRRERKDA